jgi:hypothetical protein
MDKREDLSAGIIGEKAMNTNFVAVIKRIIAEQGEDILTNPQRLKGYVSDYAARESKAERLAFGRCIEYGAYTELKSAPDTEARLMVKAALAQKVNSNEGLDVALCKDVLDVLEAAMFGTRAPQIQTVPPKAAPRKGRHEPVLVFESVVGLVTWLVFLGLVIAIVVWVRKSIKEWEWAMNTNFVKIIKRIIADQGEDILCKISIKNE